MVALPLTRSQRQRRREAPRRERRSRASRLQPLRGVPVGGDEQGVAFPEELAYCLGGGMDERGGRLLELPGTVQGILGENRIDAQRTDSRVLPSSRCLLVDAPNQGGDPPALLFDRQVAPARERIKLDGLGGRVLVLAEGLSSAAGGRLPGAVEPVALERLAFDQRPRAVDAGPVEHALDEILLDSVAQEVLQALHLGGLLVADRNRLVTPGENLVLPLRQADHLPGEVGVQVPHEKGQPAGVRSPDQEVVVARQEDDPADRDRIETLRPAEDAQGDLVEFRAGPEQEPALLGPAGDLEQAPALRRMA